jgi:hypothetical protein
MTTQLERDALIASSGPQAVIQPIDVNARFEANLEQLQQPFTGPNVEINQGVNTPRDYFTRDEFLAAEWHIELTKAQGDFIAEQTLFLETGGAPTDEGYEARLRRYSYAQSRLIRAQAAVLGKLGII